MRVRKYPLPLLTMIVHFNPFFSDVALKLKQFFFRYIVTAISKTSRNEIIQFISTNK